MRLPDATALATMCACLLCAAAPADAQLLRGRVLDALNGGPVTMAAVHLLDRERSHVALAMADSLGRYHIEVPDSGEYILVAQRFGYFDLESPLFAVSGTRSYDLDLELRPEPVGLGAINVTVRNEQVVDWLRLEFGVNPAGAFGFRIVQGAQLEEAKARGKLRPTETLRWLYVPVSHGSCVSINALPRARSVSLMTGPRVSSFGEPGVAPAGTVSPEEPATDDGPSGCGTLIVDDRVVPNELLDTIDLSRVAVIVTLPGSVRMYTYEFDWTLRGR